MIRYAGKTLLGFWVFIPVLGMYIANIALQGSAWVGDAVFVVRGTSLIAWLVGVTLSGVAAVDAARLSTKGRVHHVADSGRGFKEFTGAALATFLPVVLAHVTALTVAFALSDVIIRSFGSIILAILAGLTAIFWFIAFGSAIGRFLPPIIAGPVAVVVYFLQLAFMGMTASEPAFRVLGDSGASVSQVGLTWNAAHLVAQILILSITGLVLLAIPRGRVGNHGMPSPIALGGFALVLMIFVSSAQLISGRPMQANDAVPDHCFQGETEICLYAEHAEIGRPYVYYLDSMYETARENGYEALIPDRVVEVSVRGPEDLPGITGATRFLPPIDATEEFSPHALVSNVSVPLQCTDLFTDQEPSERYFRDWDAITATWGALVGLDDLVIPAQGRQLTPAEVAEVMKRWNTCDL